MLYKIFFEQLWKVGENTKVVHYFDNSKGNFFLRGQNLNGLAANQVQNLSTNVQCQTGACGQVQKKIQIHQFSFLRIEKI